MKGYIHPVTDDGKRDDRISRFLWSFVVTGDRRQIMLMRGICHVTLGESGCVSELITLIGLHKTDQDRYAIAMEPGEGGRFILLNLVLSPRVSEFDRILRFLCGFEAFALIKPGMTLEH